MTHEERAWSVIDKLRDGWCYGPCGVQAGCGCSLAIVDALRTVELEAYERAAKVASCKSAMLPHQHDFVRGYANGRADAAQAIRALGKDSGS
jgi:hypothetical protein